MSGLDVDEHDGSRLFGPFIDLVDDLVRNDHAVLAILAGRTLGHHRDQVQGRLDRGGRVGCLPPGHLTLQPPQHFILGEFPQRPHPL